jgi:hypothetical protein
MELIEMPERQKTYTSFYENGEWRSARVFVLPGAMSIAAILRFERATGRQTHVTPRGHLEMVQTAKSPN